MNHARRGRGLHSRERFLSQSRRLLAGSQAFWDQALSKILLVKCSQNAGYLTAMSFPLGPMYLASSLRHDSDKHDVRIYDMRLRGEDAPALEKQLAEFRPDIIGLSALTKEVPTMQLAARTARSCGFDGPIIAGGPHATAYPDDTLASPEIDYAIVGEGERTICELVRCLGSGGDISQVQGVAYRAGETVARTSAREPVANLDDLPMAAWDLVDPFEYGKYPSMSGVRTEPFVNLLTSRACPYRCAYCHSIFGKRFRARSPENVVGEIRQIVDRFGISYLEIVDDVFNCDLPRAKRILDLLLAMGLELKVTFPNGLRCDALDRDFLERLARFPFAHICVPVESTSPRIQKLMRKNLDIERVKETIDSCAELGIYTRGFFMIGYPTETMEEIRATVDFAVHSKLHTAVFFAVVPFRGTELYEQCIDVIRNRGFKQEDHDFFRSPLNLSAAPDAFVHRVQRWAYIRTALRPSRVYRVLRDLPDYRVIWHALKVWYEYFRAAGRGHRSAAAPRY
jgi:anaerobic magnesium-protoporphyrin IX monomethyl ester cyclase